MPDAIFLERSIFSESSNSVQGPGSSAFGAIKDPVWRVVLDEIVDLPIRKTLSEVAAVGLGREEGVSDRSVMLLEAIEGAKA